MRVTINHLLDSATNTPSPNYDARPNGSDITMVVIHCISLPRGEFGTGLPSQLFTNCIDFEAHSELLELDGVRVSAHLLIDRAGAVTQFVPFDKRAWHAGLSVWQGKSNCNDSSIGIELEGTDDMAFEENQYDALIQVLTALFTRYPTLAIGNIVAHSEIALGRKTDPGRFFEWDRVFTQLISQSPVRQFT